MKTSFHSFILLLLSCLGLFSCKQGDKPVPPIERMEKYSTVKKYPGRVSAESLGAWKKALPDIQDVRIKSTADGQVEPALFYASESSRKKPLLVVLHSWSNTYLQVPSLPFALWAEKYDWAFIQPNFRGIFDDPEAMASEVAIQDVVDAVAYAKQHANIDTTRIYLLGASGGAMTSLVSAGRHPEIWAGVAAWVPVFDIPDWYDFNLYYPHRKYIAQIENTLGGKPLPGTEAEAEGKKRSPSTYISQAKDVPILLAHGINDLLVPASHSIRAFNALAHPSDTISQEQIDFIVKEQAIPESLQGKYNDLYFTNADPEIVFTRESGNVRLILFVGVHDMAYNPTLLWLNEQRKQVPQDSTKVQ